MIFFETPPPTVKGIKICSEILLIISNNKDLFSKLAVISRKHISSAPKELYNFETSIGHQHLSNFQN